MAPARDGPASGTTSPLRGAIAPGANVATPKVDGLSTFAACRVSRPAVRPFSAPGEAQKDRHMSLPPATRHRVTSLARNRNPLGPYRGPLPRVLGGSRGVRRFLMGEVPL